jgi:hypothetical protein
MIRKLGYKANAARAISGPIDSFVACLREHGIDPEQFGDLTRKLPSGRPRLDTQAAQERRARYAELRRHGVPVGLALRLCRRMAGTQAALRRIGQGLPPVPARRTAA